jgi:hypothetical protein
VCLLLQTFAFAVALPTTIAVVMLLVWHVRMVSSNKTTIEHAEVSAAVEHAKCPVVLRAACATRTGMCSAAVTSVYFTIKHAM